MLASSLLFPGTLLTLVLLTTTMMIIPLKAADGGYAEKEWCIADEQTEEIALQQALDWACAQKEVDCSKIGVNQGCYLPNTLAAHASYVFNDYYQKYKHRGATCYFNAAAMTNGLDPSHNTCKFVFIP